MANSNEKDKADRALRALRKDWLLGPTQSIAYDFTDEQTSKLTEIMCRLSPVPTREHQSIALFRVREIVGELVAARESGDRLTQSRRVKRLLDSVTELTSAWEDAKSDAKIRRYINGIFQDTFQDVEKHLCNKPVIEKITSLDSAVHDLKRDLRPALIAAISMISGSAKIRQSAEYRFVSELWTVWQILGSTPTLTRNPGVHEAPSKTPFQRFAECAVPPPAIGDEILRGTIEFLRG